MALPKSKKLKNFFGDPNHRTINRLTGAWLGAKYTVLVKICSFSATKRSLLFGAVPMGVTTSPRVSDGDGPVDRWLDAARGGSTSALGELLESCRGYLLLVANRAIDDNLRQKTGASDLVQETFFQAHRDFAEFRGSSEKELYAWLTQILVNRMRNAARHYRDARMRDIRREVPLERDHDLIGAQLVGEDDTPSALVAAWEEERRVREYLDQIGEPHRQVVVLRCWEGRSFAEIGERIGRTANSARKLWLRAMDRLGRELDDQA